MSRVLLVSRTTGYQTREFQQAADRHGIDLILATDRCRVLSDPWGDQAVPLDFDDPILPPELRIDAIVAVGDLPALAAARLAAPRGLRFHPPAAVQSATNKILTRRCFAESGLFTPRFQLALPGGPPPFLPCVLKPLVGSASTGVIRANTHSEYLSAIASVSRSAREIIVEEYIPGVEFALEGIVRSGTLHPITLFSKPDPLEGPYFEESIYLTHAEQPGALSAIQDAVTALGLTDGPIHAEFRLSGSTIFVLEVAPRPIGGLCSRVLRFANHCALPDILLLESLGERPPLTLTGPSGVMMIPVPAEGILEQIGGLEAARSVPFIEDIVITAKLGEHLIPWPLGNSYPGFIFSRAGNPAANELALRQAHSQLHFRLLAALPVR